MSKITFFLFFLSLLVLQLSSCKTKEKLVYFQDGQVDSLVTAKNYTPVFKTDDLLSIVITGEDLEAVLPFNLPLGGPQQSVNSGYSVGNPERAGYLIDANGAVTLPVLGNIQLAGLNRMEAKTLLEETLQPYLHNPVVHIQILNYKITVLGDVAKPGTYKIPNERITLLEAIGLAGDLNITGNRKNIMVMRDENGEKTEYRLDLTSKEIFTSPVYYLAQNDVVYVEPNKAARSNSTVWRTSGTIFISTAALIITTISVILK